MICDLLIKETTINKTHHTTRWCKNNVWILYYFFFFNSSYYHFD